jgi:hypothetical protein
VERETDRNLPTFTPRTATRAVAIVPAILGAGGHARLPVHGT